MSRNIRSKKNERQDLFDFCGSPADFWFCYVRDHPDWGEVRNHLNRMWAWYRSCGLQDPHFESEFKDKFCHRWWELQAAWFLKTIGCKISHENEGPDFVCSKDGVTFYVEAVTCSAGDQTKPDSVKPLPKGSYNLDEQQRVVSLRFTQAIREKTRKYWKFRKKAIVESGIPYVIALSPIQIKLERSLASTGLQGEPAIFNAVYGKGLDVISIDRLTGKSIAVHSQDRPSLIKNQSTTRTNIFRPSGRRCDPYRGVSGILYSELYFDSRHDDEALVDSFSLAHNANAAVGLRRGLLEVGSERTVEPSNDDWAIVRC